MQAILFMLEEIFGVCLWPQLSMCESSYDEQSDVYVYVI